MTNKGKISNLALSHYPVIISLILFIILLVIHPFEIEKYKITQIKELPSKENSTFTYADLDNDDYSERIRFICLKDGPKDSGAREMIHIPAYE